MIKRDPRKKIVLVKEFRNLDVTNEELEDLVNLARDLMSPSVEKRAHAKMKIAGINSAAQKTNLHKWVLVAFTNIDRDGLRKKLIYVSGALVGMITVSISLSSRFVIEGNSLNMLLGAAVLGLAVGGEYVERRVDKLL